MEASIVFTVILKNNHDKFYLVSTKIAISRFQHEAMDFISYQEAQVLASRAGKQLMFMLKTMKNF